jgi:hypothetical protein
MTKIELKQSLLIILALAVTSIASWLFEMTKVVGWSSLDWLQADLVSPYLICCLAAVCFMTPIVLKYQKIDSKIVLTFLSLSLVNIIAFFLAETFLKGVFNRITFFGEGSSFYFLGIVTFIGFAVSYYFITHYLIVNMPKLFILLFATSEVLMFVLAMITAYFIRGFGNNSYIADAVKMGYPQFWICILLGLCGVFILNRNVGTSEN